MRRGQENPQKSRQLTPYEQWQVTQKKKADSDKQEFTGALNDVLAQGEGDPKKAMDVLKRTAVQDPTSAHRRYFAPLLRDLSALQGKPRETQASMDFLNENGPSRPEANQRSPAYSQRRLPNPCRQIRSLRLDLHRTLLALHRRTAQEFPRHQHPQRQDRRPRRWTTWARMPSHLA